MNEEIIKTVNLVKYYDDCCALNNVNISIKKGSVCGLIGNNGAGKSTLIKIIMGLLKPTRGESKMFGINSFLLPDDYKNRIGYLIEGHPLYSGMTIEEISNFTKKFFRNWSDEKFGKFLSYFELDKKKKIRKLSKGQQAQVSISLVLAYSPELLILDDPTIGLDTGLRREFLESIIHIIQKEGSTILFSTHILNELERVADHIIMLDKGEVFVDSPIDYLREKVRKFSLNFNDVQNDIEKFSIIKGAIAVETLEKYVLISIANYNSETFDELKKFNPVNIVEIGLSLEDIYIEYCVKRKKKILDF